MSFIDEMLEQLDFHSERFTAAFNKIQFNTASQIQFLRNLERLTRTISLPAAVRHLLTATNGVHVSILLEMQSASRMGENPMSVLKNWFKPDIAAILTINDSTDVNPAINSAIQILMSPAGNIYKPFIWLLYPILILSLCLALNKYLSISLLADFREKILTSTLLPPEFMKVMNTADYVGFPLAITLALVVSFLVFGAIFLKNYIGKYRNELDKFPIFSIYREVCSIFFLRMLSNLLSTNIPNLKALEIIDSNISNKYIKNHIKNMAAIIGSGGSIRIALESGLINPKDVSTIAILSQSKGNGFYEAIRGANEIALDRLFYSLRRYSYFIGAVVFLMAFSFGLNAVTVFTSIDLLYDNSL